MNGGINPYDCSRPGNLYVGNERLRRRIVDRLRDGQSFAVVGGRRCGKSSTLLQLSSDIVYGEHAPYRIIPKMLRASELGTVSDESLFEEIYRLTIDSTAAHEWRPGQPGQAYRAFLENVTTALPAIESSLGKRWLVVLMVDEIDSLADRLPGDVFFQNVRNLLMDSDFSGNFRLIATGVNDLSGLIRSGSSPLNNLSIQQLGIIGRTSADRLVLSGFVDGLPDNGMDELERLTGRHPYLLQGVLQHLWMEHGESRKRGQIRRAADEFVREHRDFQRWVEAFGDVEKAVYRILDEAPDSMASIQEIRNALPPQYAHRVDDALVVLSTHGVINDIDPDEPRIAGSLFREWFRSRYPNVEEKREPTDYPPPQAPPGDVRAHTTVTVNPTFVVGNTISIVTADEALPIISGLKSILDGLELDPRTRTEAENALRTAAAEVELDKSGMAHDKNQVAASIEQATQVVKAAEGAAGAVHRFIERAEQLAPYLGQAANWLSTLA